MKSTLSIEQDFVVMSPEKNVSIEHCDPGLYGRLDANYNNFAGHELISCHEFSSDWPSWEIHPHGDEVVILMSGNITFMIQIDSGETSVELNEPGQYVVAPRGAWHTARTSAQAKLLFVTPGQGTQNRDI